jgi:hypothetical protein
MPLLFLVYINIMMPHLFHHGFYRRRGVQPARCVGYPDRCGLVVTDVAMLRLVKVLPEEPLRCHALAIFSVDGEYVGDVWRQ